MRSAGARRRQPKGEHALLGEPDHGAARVDEAERRIRHCSSFVEQEVRNFAVQLALQQCRHGLGVAAHHLFVAAQHDPDVVCGGESGREQILDRVEHHDERPLVVEGAAPCDPVLARG